MNGYFKPFRRELGVVTLLLACVLTSGLIRSESVRDTLNCWAGKRTPALLVSTSGYILWAKAFLDPGTGATFFYWTADDIKTPNVVNEISEEDQSQLGWFKIVAIKTATDSIPVWVISYWSLILPMTLLSAYLLLSRPRARTSPSTPNFRWIRYLTPAAQKTD